VFAVKGKTQNAKKGGNIKDHKKAFMRMMNIKHNIHQEAFKTKPENMQNKINQSNGTYTHIFLSGRGLGTSKYMIMILCRINSIPITLYHSPSYKL
jgi:translation initiation factor IF-3